jgi:hypothetical protein
MKQIGVEAFGSNRETVQRFRETGDARTAALPALWLPIGLVAACGTLAPVLSHLRADDRFLHLEEP